MWWVYLAVPLGSYLMCFRFLQVMAVALAATHLLQYELSTSALQSRKLVAYADNSRHLFLARMELTMAELPAAHPSRGPLGDAANAAQSAAALTRQLLAFSRKEVIGSRVWRTS
mgnify:CR=1 FL=1